MTLFAVKQRSADHCAIQRRSQDMQVTQLRKWSFEACQALLESWLLPRCVTDALKHVSHTKEQIRTCNLPSSGGRASRSLCETKSTRKEDASAIPTGICVMQLWESISSLRTGMLPHSPCGSFASSAWVIECVQQIVSENTLLRANLPLPIS